MYPHIDDMYTHTITTTTHTHAYMYPHIDNMHTHIHKMVCRNKVKLPHQNLQNASQYQVHSTDFKVLVPSLSMRQTSC